MNDAITIETVVNAPIGKVWDHWSKPEHIVGWAFASDDWEARAAENDLRPGGTFKTVMAAKDGSQQFDFSGTYTSVEEQELIEYTMDDDRRVKVEFAETADGVRVTTSFEPEGENPKEVQKAGWQAILDNFKKYSETHAGA